MYVSYVRLYICICIRLCVYIYVCVCIYICMCVCLYIYVSSFLEHLSLTSNFPNLSLILSSLDPLFSLFVRSAGFFYLVLGFFSSRVGTLFLYLYLEKLWEDFVCLICVVRGVYDAYIMSCV